MKYLLSFLVVVMLSLALPSFAQTESVQVDITKLSQQELLVYQQLKQKQAANSMSVANLTPETIDRYAQIGKSFGTAFKECWTTVSTDAERFANSSAGKWAMVMVTWKIMGDDAVNLVEKSVQYAIGFPLIFIGTCFFIYIIRRNCMSRPILVSATKVAFLTVKKEYKGTSSPQWDGEHAAVAVLFYALFIAVCCAILFIG